MWVAKVLIDGRKAAGGELCRKYQIEALVYPISSQIRKDGVYLYFSAILKGADDKIKKNLMKNLSKNKRFVYAEMNNNFILGLLKESLAIKDLYNHNFIHVEPIMIGKEGYETWTIACWNRSDLLKFIEVMDKKYNGKLLKMKQEKLTSITIMHTHPNLTDKQKNAMDLAIDRGYYDYPRKTDLKELSKVMNVSYSTFQAHIRKAENEIIPFRFKKDF